MVLKWRHKHEFNFLKIKISILFNFLQKEMLHNKCLILLLHSTARLHTLVNKVHSPTFDLFIQNIIKIPKHKYEQQ